jgi:hypothetical protein
VGRATALEPELSGRAPLLNTRLVVSVYGLAGELGTVRIPPNPERVGTRLVGVANAGTCAFCSDGPRGATEFAGSTRGEATPCGEPPE